MNIIVTGGAGFIGSNLLIYMTTKYPHYNFLCLDKLTYAGNLDNLQSVMGLSNFRFSKTDICDREAVYGLFAEFKPDVVINMAAESHVDRSIATPEVFLQTNIFGVSVLLDACREFGNVYFHQISTDEVYGDLPLDTMAASANGKDALGATVSAIANGNNGERALNGIANEADCDLSLTSAMAFTENSPLRPSSPYSSSKASADLLVMAYRRTYGLPVTISRCSNNYGPYQHHEKLIPLMVERALVEQPLPVYGTGLNVRDWIYVEDHCRAIDLIIHSGRYGEIYNVGGNCEISNIELVRRICRELGKSEQLITYVVDRKGHDLRYAMDYSKLTRDLGWQPTTDFEQGLKRTIRWYVEQKIAK